MNKIVVAVSLFFFGLAAAFPSHAQEATQTKISTAEAQAITEALPAEVTSMVDVPAFLVKARVGIAWDNHGNTWKIAYLPVISWLPDTTGEVLNLDGGVIQRSDENIVGGMLALGVRIDTIFGMMFSGEYGKTHIKKAKLPTFEVPAGVALIARNGFKPTGFLHAGIAVGF